MVRTSFKKFIQVTALVLTLVLAANAFARKAPPMVDGATTAQRTVIRNVTVIQPGAKKVSTSVADVWLENGMIQAVLRPGSTAPKSTSSDLKQIDGSGRFLLPGLIDSHVHLANVAGMTGAQKKKYPQALSAYWQQLPRSYLYYGFTSLVDLNAYHPNQIKAFTQSPVAPRLWHCGPQVSVYEDFTFAVEGLSEAEKLEQDFVLDPALATPATVKNPHKHSVPKTMQKLKDAGASCIKMLVEDETVGLPVNWQSPSTKLVSEFAQAGAQSNMPVVLHAPSAAGHQLALSSGVSVLAHGLWARELSEKSFQSNDLSAQDSDLLKQVAERGIGYQPTLRVINAEQELLNPSAVKNKLYEKVYPSDYLRYLQTEDAQWGVKKLASRPQIWSPELRQAIKSFPGAKGADGLRLLEHAYPMYRERLRHVLNKLHQHKAKLLLGSDTPAMNLYTQPPGLNGYLEMLAWQDAGIPPKQILRAATYNNAQVFRLSKVGQIRADMHADLLLLRENPLKDIRAMESIDMVFVQGRAYERESFAASRLE